MIRIVNGRVRKRIRREHENGFNIDRYADD